MLICSITKIHKELKDKETEVNTTNIILHATSFGLFTLSYVAQRLFIIIFAKP